MGSEIDQSQWRGCTIDSMNIAAGLSGLNAAVTMTRALRDGLKSGSVKPDEIAGRIGEIYDYIIDSKSALADAQEEIRHLKAQLDSLNRDAGVFLEGGVNWEKRPDERYDGPLCPVCWGLNHKRLPMEMNERRNHPDYVVYDCAHHTPFVDRRVPKSILDRYIK